MGKEPWAPWVRRGSEPAGQLKLFQTVLPEEAEPSKNVQSWSPLCRIHAWQDPGGG